MSLAIGFPHEDIMELNAGILMEIFRHNIHPLQGIGYIISLFSALAHTLIYEFQLIFLQGEIIAILTLADADKAPKGPFPFLYTICLYE